MDKQEQYEGEEHLSSQPGSPESVEDILGLLEAVLGSSGGEQAGPSTVAPLGYDAADSGGKEDINGGHGDSDISPSDSGSGKDPSHNSPGGEEEARNQQHSAGRRGRPMLHKRSERLNGKLRELQQLISADATMDKASLLDTAIAYVKSLQLQLTSGTCTICQARLLLESATMQCAAKMPLSTVTYTTDTLYEESPIGTPVMPSTSMLSTTSVGESQKEEDEYDKPATTATPNQNLN